MEKLKFSTKDVFDSIGLEFFSEAGCREWALKLLYNDQPKCPRCSAPLPENAALKFWRNQQCYCPACRSKFAPTSGTILKSTKLQFRQVILISLLIELGMKTGEVALRTGLDPHAIARWKKKLRRDYGR